MTEYGTLSLSEENGFAEEVPLPKQSASAAVPWLVVAAAVVVVGGVVRSWYAGLLDRGGENTRSKDGKQGGDKQPEASETSGTAQQGGWRLDEVPGASVMAPGTSSSRCLFDWRCVICDPDAPAGTWVHWPKGGSGTPDPATPLETGKPHRYIWCAEEDTFWKAAESCSKGTVCRVQDGKSCGKVVQRRRRGDGKFEEV